MKMPLNARPGSATRRLAHLHALQQQISGWLRGRDSLRRPGWCTADLVQWSLLVPHDSPTLMLGAAHNAPLRHLPTHLPSPLNGERVPLQWQRAQRPVAQRGAWPPNIDVVQGPLGGTVAGLVRYTHADQRYGLLTAGHVLAGDPAACFGDAVFVSDGGNAIAGSLSCWQPSLGSTAPSTEFDAALAEISPADAASLFQEFHHELPSGVSAQVFAGQAVQVRSRGGPCVGQAVGLYSGPVDIASTSMEQDFFIEGAVACLLSPSTAGGDSGSAVWDAAGALLGVHCAGFADSPPDRPWNALFSRIDPVLARFSVQVVTRSDPLLAPAAAGGTTQPGPLPSLGIAPQASVAKEIDLLARTLYGEARGEGAAGMEAVACVVMNRVDTGRWGRAISQVCLANKQFSCWNADGNNRRALLRANAGDAAFASALEIATRAQARALADSTFGATHYHATGIALPNWALGQTPCLRLGKHVFYAHIR
jgi:Cell Wall Hydrolase